MRCVTRPLTIEARTRLKGIRVEYSQFSASWSSTLDLLDRELRHLGVRDEFVMQIDVTEVDLKLNGELRANARPASAAAAISIDTRARGALLFVCGKFPHWQENVRAIALGLEALRKVDRYGITQASEQYRGFGALPPGTPMPAAKMTVEEAARLLAEQANMASGNDMNAADVMSDGGEFAYRTAAKVLHPDVGGDAEQFRLITEARDVLREWAAVA